MSNQPALDELPALAYRGPCGCCGDVDARHRLIDAVVERLDPAEVLAEEFGLTPEAVRTLKTLTSRQLAVWLAETRDTWSSVTDHLRISYLRGSEAATLDLYVTVCCADEAHTVPVGLLVRARPGEPEQGYLRIIGELVTDGLRHGRPLLALVRPWRGSRFRPEGTWLDAPDAARDSESPHVHVSSPADAVARYLIARFERTEADASEEQTDVAEPVGD